MSKFNAFMNVHFSNCRLIARARDVSRQRNVTIHQIPGYWDCVGVSDGVDAWIAPCAAGPFFKTATGDVADIMRRLQAGDLLPPIPDAPKRARVRVDDDPPPRRTRVQVIEAEVVPSATRRLRVQPA